MSAIFVAVMVALASTVSPVVLAIITGRQRRLERQAEWARQDAIHQRDRDESRANHEQVNGQLKVIETLVDGNLTATLQAEHDGAVREVMLMRELGRPAEVIAQADARIAELRAVLEDRARQMDLINKQIETEVTDSDA